jgi:hypothetical protein
VPGSVKISDIGQRALRDAKGAAHELVDVGRGSLYITVVAGRNLRDMER